MHKNVYLFLLALFLVPLVSGCGTGNTDTGEVQNLTGVEVREYKGQNLSSINDFRENSIEGPQNVDIKTYSLKVDGLVAKPMDFKYDEILKNTKYTKVVRLNCVEGWSVDILWEGILLKDLLDQVKVDSAANTVIFYAVDGYSTSLPLQTILDKELILAYKMNGIVLPPERGFPFQLVAEDKLGYKWAKWINRIELSSNKDYLGYWEQRGYSNEADIPVK
ncbi:MAG: molybdopterin-dependent oxidoreductase [Clostridia bacterium]